MYPFGSPEEFKKTETPKGTALASAGAQQGHG
jgi:hypothetical protein